MLQDKIFKKILFAGALFIVLLTITVFVTILNGSIPSIKKFGIHFLVSTQWNPVSGKFGALPFIEGTLVTSILAIIISIPFSLSVALFLGEFFKEGIFNEILSSAVDLLAGIPSVIYGFWGLVFLVPIIRNMEIKFGITPYGVGILTASVVLAIMIIPYTASIAREVIKLTPQDIKEAGYSLGGTRLDVIRSIVFPNARSGIFAGIFLGLGRALGETMAVTMVIGNSNSLPKTIFSPSNTMASVIANEFTEATTNIHLSSLIQIGLWLFIITLLVNYFGGIVIEKMKIRESLDE
jgi:phosphate transport system permease protein